MKTGPFKWAPKAEEVLQDLRKYLASLPVQVALKLEEPLLLYITATSRVVSVVLVAE